MKQWAIKCPLLRFYSVLSLFLINTLYYIYIYESARQELTSMDLSVYLNHYDWALSLFF